MANSAELDPYAGFPADAPSELVDGHTTRLHRAASLDDADELARLLALPGCDPNIQDQRLGLTPLAEAAYFGSLKCAELLLGDKRVEVDQIDHQGRTPLIIAAEMGRLPIVKALAKIANLEHVAIVGGAPGNALMVAAASKHTACAKFLAKLIDPKAKAPDGSTALMHAADGGILACVRFLIPLSDVHATDIKGRTAFMRAAWMDKKNAMLELLPVSNPFFQDARGADALALAREAAETKMRENPDVPLLETANFLNAYALALSEMSHISQAAPIQVADASTSSKPRL